MGNPHSHFEQQLPPGLLRDVHLCTNRKRKQAFVDPEPPFRQRACVRHALHLQALRAAAFEAKRSRLIKYEANFTLPVDKLSPSTWALKWYLLLRSSSVPAVAHEEFREFSSWRKLRPEDAVPPPPPRILS